METIFNYTFKDEAFLKQALRHSSAKTDNLASNERLEFLGDAILGVVISELLYKKFPDREEGELTLIKSEVVSRSVLNLVAREHGIDEVIETGKGIKQIPDSILANAVESIIAAIYLESGLEVIANIIKDIFSAKIEEISQRSGEINYKAMLQHFTQKEYTIIPEYRLIKTTGPAHEPKFEVAVRIDKEEYGTGIGKTKKEAEQYAAKIALEQIKAKSQ